MTAAASEIGILSATVSLVLELTGSKLTGVELPILVSLDWGAVGCFTVTGAMMGIGLLPLTGDCDIGNAAGVGVKVRVGAGDVSEMSEALLLLGTGPAPWADEDMGWSKMGWSKELLDCDAGAVFVSGAADAGGGSVDGAVEIICDWAVGD